MAELEQVEVKELGSSRTGRAWCLRREDEGGGGGRAVTTTTSAVQDAGEDCSRIDACADDHRDVHRRPRAPAGVKG